MEVPEPQQSNINEKINVYNFSSENLTSGEISLLALGPKYVPATKIPEDDVKLDILRFSRKLLLNFHFHNSDYNDNSIVKHNSIYMQCS